MSLWQSLLLAGAGGVLALSGTWMGFYLQAREQRRVRSDQLAREGLLRLHGDRITSYTAFYKEGGAMRRALRAVASTPNDEGVRQEAWKQRSILWGACASVTLLGSREAASAAWDLLTYATDVVDMRAAFDVHRFSELIWNFILRARLDLNHPDAPSTPLSAAWINPETTTPAASRPTPTAGVE